MRSSAITDQLMGQSGVGKGGCLRGETTESCQTGDLLKKKEICSAARKTPCVKKRAHQPERPPIPETGIDAAWVRRATLPVRGKGESEERDMRFC